MQDTLNWLVLMIELIHRIGSNRLVPDSELALLKSVAATLLPLQIPILPFPYPSAFRLFIRIKDRLCLLKSFYSLNQRETEEVVDSIFLSSGQNRSITGLVFAVKGAILIAFASI
ncbi:hypothetical protein L6164_010019 [Bauhinia variegata]|uniref:Uncharacterized protein n=1 Tax=Bauhinia variegata TaxID=167791 RepID=A0ACB9PN29_BAUVA|nr:hypothetical protein L6164_010019 [Bauhinia variegata]